MNKIKIEFDFCGVHHAYTAEFEKPLFGDGDGLNIENNRIVDNGQDVKVVTGMSDELGVWSLYFGNVEVDFEAYINPDEEEVCTLKPVDLFIWDKDGKCLNEKAIPFQMQLG